MCLVRRSLGEAILQNATSAQLKILPRIIFWILSNNAYLKPDPNVKTLTETMELKEDMGLLLVLGAIVGYVSNAREAADLIK